MKKYLSQCALIGLLCGLMISAPACNFSTGLQEAEHYLSEIQPFVSLVPAFVCPFDANACSAVNSALQVEQPAELAVSGFFNDWAAASSAAQPALLSQVIAAIAPLQKDQAALIAAAQVKNSAAQTKIDGILNSVETSTIDFLNLLQEARSGGGTSAALASVIENDEASYETPVLAFFVANPLKVFYSSNTLKLKSGRKIHTVKYHKSYIVSVLKVKTGDAQVDAIAKQKLAGLK